MATVNENYAKIAKIQLPGTNSNPYALMDAALRLMVTQKWASGASYSIGDLVIFTDPSFSTGGRDRLYRCTTDNEDENFNESHWTETTIADELARVWSELTGGIHYRGVTTTNLYDGSTANPIQINGESYNAENGDLVIVNYEGISATYAASTAYSAHTYLKNNNKYYITNAEITAQENVDFNAIEEKVDQIKGEPEFLFDGTYWYALGGIGDGLGSLAYKDSAQGTYVKPTGSGSVTVKEYSANTSKLVTGSVLGVKSSTTTASKATAGTAVSVAKAGTAVVYGKADVGNAVVYGTANKAASATTVGNANKASTATTVGNANVGSAVTVAQAGSAVVYGIADVDEAVVYGTANKAASATVVGNANRAATATTVGNANVGSAVTVAQAGTQVVYGTADVGDEVTYGNANVGSTKTGIAEVGSQKSFNTDGIKISEVSGDTLIFGNAATDNVIGIKDTTGVSVVQATASSTKLTPAKAADTTRKLTPVGDTVNITPAVQSSTSIYGAETSTTSIYGAVDAPSSQTLTPAKAADETRTLTPVGDTVSINPAVQSSTSIYGAVDSNTTIYGAVDAPSSQTLTPATAAPNTQTIIPAVSNGTITPYSFDDVVVPVKDDSATTIATGSLDVNGSGASIATGVSESSVAKTVTVGTEDATVVVR